MRALRRLSRENYIVVTATARRCPPEYQNCAAAAAADYGYLRNKQIVARIFQRLILEISDSECSEDYTVLSLRRTIIARATGERDVA